MTFLVTLVFLAGCVSLVASAVVLIAAVWFAATSTTQTRPEHPALTLVEHPLAPVVSLADARARRQTGGVA